MTLTNRFQRHVSVPPYTRNLTSNDQIKWSAEFEVPRIGDEVVIRINNIGQARVVGYATQDGYLGVMAVPYDPPDWSVRQNGPPSLARPALAFGAEIGPAARGELT